MQGLRGNVYFTNCIFDGGSLASQSDILRRNIYLGVDVTSSGRERYQKVRNNIIISIITFNHECLLLFGLTDRNSLVDQTHRKSTRRENIGRRRTTKIGRRRTTKIGRRRKIEIGRRRTIEIKQERATEVGRERTTKVRQERTIEVDRKLTTEFRREITAEIGQERKIEIR